MTLTDEYNIHLQDTGERASDIDKAKDAYLALGRYDIDKAHEKGEYNYEATYNAFKVWYDLLTDFDKQEFEQWREEHGYNW